MHTWWASNNGSWSRADPHWLPAHVCLCLGNKKPLCLRSACQVSGLIQNLQIMIHDDCLAQTSQCSFITPAEFSVTFCPWKAFIWNTGVYLCLQWKYWFFCSRSPDTTPRTHFYIGELWLKMEQFPPPALLWVTCWGHIFLCSHGQNWLYCLNRIQLP